MWFSAYKSSDISETRQDRTKDQYEVPYAPSIDAKINDVTTSDDREVEG